MPISPKNQKFITAGIGLILLLSAGLIYRSWSAVPAPKTPPAASLPAPETSPAVVKAPAAVATSTAEPPSELINIPTALPDGTMKYVNRDYEFSLIYPKGFAVSEYREREGAYTMAFEEEAGDKGFQIYVTPYEEAEVTPERFKLDEPSGVHDESMVVLVDNVRAEAFFSQNAIMGRTREVWFINNGFLYEVTTYAELDQWLGQIMQSWKFE